MPNEELKQKNISCALETAYSCFLEEGINSVTRFEISQKSGISVSSLNRYWENTTDCVLKTAEWYCRHIKSIFDRHCESEAWRGKNGIERLQSYMEWCRDLYCREPRFFALFVEFRVYLYRSTDVSDEERKRFDRMLSVEPVVMRLYERGILDGSIRRLCSGSCSEESEPVFLIKSFYCYLSNLSLQTKHDLDKEITEIDRYIKSVIRLFKN